MTSRHKTGARLRRTFAYPDSDNDSGNSDLDETEQDTLIDRLQSQSASTDALYIRIFTYLPLACLPAYLFYLFGGVATRSPLVRTLCLLCMTSLLGSSLGMWMAFRVAKSNQHKFKSGYGLGRRKGTETAAAVSASVVKVPILGDIDSDGPLGRVLPWLNPTICTLLFIAAWGVKGRDVSSGVPDGFWLFLLLPGVILGMTLVAERSIKEVEQDIVELKDMRYGYKGA